MRPRGWLFPMLVQGDAIFGHGRWAYLERSLDAGHLLDDPIPRIGFRSSGSTEVRAELRDLSHEVAERGDFKGPPLSAAGAKRHLEGIPEPSHGGGKL